jgi:mannose-6-phosphate isomerase-like protein (cupin superfamily)
MTPRLAFARLLVLAAVPVLAAPVGVAAWVRARPAACDRHAAPSPAARRPFVASLIEAALTNDAFRRVLHTGEQTQLVVMRLEPGADIGEERHAKVEQTFVVVQGAGDVVLDGARRPITVGDVIVVPAATTHDLVAGRNGPLVLVTIYAPPSHLDGVVHATKADAEGDAEDQAFGRCVEGER